MKPRKVKGLDPDAPLADNAARIIRVRLAELYSFAPRALKGRDPKSLHDMRIAAKRLRYVLELTAFCFGPYARKAARRARDVQDLLGEIHDHDVLLPRVLGQIETLRAADMEALCEFAGDDGELTPELLAHAPNRHAYRGLELLAIYTQARRKLYFERFLELWHHLQREDLHGRLKRALEQPPAPDPDGERADAVPTAAPAEQAPSPA